MCLLTFILAVDASSSTPTVTPVDSCLVSAGRVTSVVVCVSPGRDTVNSAQEVYVGVRFEGEGRGTDGVISALCTVAVPTPPSTPPNK